MTLREYKICRKEDKESNYRLILLLLEGCIRISFIAFVMRSYNTAQVLKSGAFVSYRNSTNSRLTYKITWFNGSAIKSIISRCSEKDLPAPKSPSRPDSSER